MRRADDLARDVLALADENERLTAECCRCEKCGHVQAEPNWCHVCGHRTTPQPWAVRLLDEIEAAREEAAEAALHLPLELEDEIKSYADERQMPITQVLASLLRLGLMFEAASAAQQRYQGTAAGSLPQEQA